MHTANARCASFDVGLFVVSLDRLEPSESVPWKPPGAADGKHPGDKMIDRVIGLLRRTTGEAREVQAALVGIDRRRQTIRIEVEKTQVRFNTRISVRRDVIVVAKPAALEAVLHAGTLVRFKLPSQPQREVRMEVVTPHFNLTNKQPVFLCRQPVAFCTASQRQSDRFDTRRFTNLRLELPGFAEPFRILDISQHGLRIEVHSPRPQKEFPANQPLGQGMIHMGRRVSVEVASLVPRTYMGNAVGFAMTVSSKGDHRKLLAHLLRTLDSQQRERLQAEAL